MEAGHGQGEDLDALSALRVRDLGVVRFEDAWRRMREFTEARHESTIDELWLLEHPAVYTRGIRARHEPPGGLPGVPSVDTDRGGLTTYHGPGQIIGYVLLDIRRRRWGAAPPTRFGPLRPRWGLR